MEAKKQAQRHLICYISIHLSFSSLRFSFSPSESSFTPESCRLLLLRSRSFRLLESELRTEARAEQLSSVRSHLLSLKIIQKISITSLNMSYSCDCFGVESSQIKSLLFTSALQYLDGKIVSKSSHSPLARQNQQFKLSLKLRV